MLIVLAHPFPFIAVAFFARSIFLRMADKAALLDRLQIAEREYAREVELSKLKDELVSVISHELRTPLTAIKLYVSLLLSGKFGELTEKQQKPITVVQEESDRLAKLINDILSLSRLESKKSKLELEQADFSKVVDKDFFKPLLDNKSISLVDEIPSPFPVVVDKEKLKRVVINLIDNAAKFTPAGGTITLGGEKTRDGFSFFVSDNGKGIPTEKIPHLFDKFYQVEDHLTRQAGGTGLGLAIVKSIIELHQGTITVESEVGKGSKFIITIPSLKLGGTDVDKE